jgi:transcriptional regulator with XRE-family HTH domain
VNPIDGDVGQRIAQAKRRRGLSQAVLAGLVGRSESWLSQVERGKRGVDSQSESLVAGESACRPGSVHPR